MPRFSLRSFLFWIIALAALAADAQMVNPAKFTSSFNKLSDTAAEIVFTGTIEPGWHVYSTDVGDDGPTAATFNVDNISGAVLDGPLKAVGNPIRKHDDMFDMEVSYFEHSAKFVQKLKLTGGKYAVEGYLQYGACNDQTCVPPKNVEVKFTGEVPAQAAKNQQTAPAQDKNKNGKKEPDAQQTPQAQSSQVDTKNTAIAVAAAANAEQKALVDGKDGASSVDSKKKEDKESVEDEPDDYSLAYAADSVLTDSMGTGEGTDSISVAAALGDEGLWTPVISELKAFDKGGNANASDSPLWKIFLLGLLGGLVALVTPCVWPIIPMTVSFFLKRSGDKKKGIRDAWIYGLSIVVIYVLLGLLVTGLFGASALNSLSTNAIFNIFFFLLLLVFAASFFGAFELTLPSSWSSAVDSKAEKTGGLIGIFLMAFTLTLVSFSCTGPIIGFLLVEVAADGGSIIAPTVGMLGFAIALALPFTLFALFPSWLKSMPKSGGWMNTVKVVLGFIELAFALKFLSVADLAYGWRILDRETFLALWIVIFGLLGLYLLGKIKFKHDDDDTHIGVFRFFLALISLAFAVYMIPGLWGAPLKAVSAFAPPMKTQDFNLAPEQEVKPMFTDYEEGMAYAKAHNKPVLIDFTGYGCVNCRKMEAAVWTDSRVADKMTNDYVLIQLYVDEKKNLDEPMIVNENGEERKLRTVGDKWSYLQSHKFGANAQPFYVLLDGNGRLLNKAYSYDENIDHYLEFLDTGMKRFE
jgi:thiol:disulfide interchange protein DsbD